HRDRADRVGRDAPRAPGALAQLRADGDRGPDDPEPAAPRAEPRHDQADRRERDREDDERRHGACPVTYRSGVLIGQDVAERVGRELDGARCRIDDTGFRARPGAPLARVRLIRTDLTHARSSDLSATWISVTGRVESAPKSSVDGRRPLEISCDASAAI